MPFNRDQMKVKATELASQGVFIGTSSWKYEGWFGQLYDRARYEWRGKFAESRFNRNCLAEYAEVFKTVCVDAAYYTFPSQQYLEGMLNQTPDDFVFGLKVTDAVTISIAATTPPHGLRATARPICATSIVCVSRVR